MTRRIQGVLVGLAVGVLTCCALWKAEAQAPACQYFKVRANTANVSKEPRADSIFIDLLDKGDIVCVTRNQKAGDVELAYILHKVPEPGKRTRVEGWVDRTVLQQMAANEVAAATGGAETQPAGPGITRNPNAGPSAATSAGRNDSTNAAPGAAVNAAPGPAPNARPSAAAGARPSATPSPAQAAPPQDDVFRYSKPLPRGPYPVVGNSIEQLASGIPLFPPFDGLDPSQWQKNCSNCHKWDRNTLCAQGGIYVKNPQLILRHPHPYGGAFKTAVMEWAKTGCQ